MPIIDVNIRDLEKLIGRKLNVDDIEKHLPMLKCELEGIEGDIVTYEATHDRPDLFSAEGLARALKGLMKIELGMRKYNIVLNNKLEVINQGPTYRPYVLGAIVKNVEFNDEALRQIFNLQEKLHVTYCRNRRKVSIGVYDLDTIEPPIYYKAVNPIDVKFMPLDYSEELNLEEILKKTEKGVMYGHLILEYSRNIYPLLVDSKGTVLSLPPIINSEDTRVTTKTRNVFIDVTGTDLRTMMDVLKIITTSIAERGKPERIELVKVVAKDKEIVSPNLSIETIDVDIGYARRLLGIELTTDDAIEYLKMMRYDVEKLGEEQVRAYIPLYRIDILHQVDVIEDIIIAYGYNNITPELPSPPIHGVPHPLEVFTRKLREIMIGLGFQEVVTYMMNNPETLIKKMRLKDIKLVEVSNPRMEKYTSLRNWITPCLLEVISANKHLGKTIKVFEVGDVAIVDESMENKARIERHLVFAIVSPDITLTDGLVYLKALMSTLSIDYSLEKSIHPSFIEGRTAKIRVKGKEIGLIGEIHPEVLLNFNITMPVVIAEMNVNTIMDFIKRRQ